MSEKTMLCVAVPTSTLIITKKGDPAKVLVFESNGKFGNKKLLPGGKVKVGKQSCLETAITEAEEEVGIIDLTNIKLFTLSSRPNRDVRQVSLEKFLDGSPAPSGLESIGLVVETHHGFDAVYVAETEMEPTPDNEETKNAYFIDARSVNQHEFALDHGRLVNAYARFLKTGELPALDEF